MVFTNLLNLRRTYQPHTETQKKKSVYHLLNIIKHEITKTITAHKLPSPNAL